MGIKKLLVLTLCLLMVSCASQMYPSSDDSLIIQILKERRLKCTKWVTAMRKG